MVAEKALGRRLLVGRELAGGHMTIDAAGVADERHHCGQHGQREQRGAERRRKLAVTVRFARGAKVLV